jgi:hypothetical protein
MAPHTEFALYSIRASPLPGQRKNKAQNQYAERLVLQTLLGFSLLIFGVITAHPFNYAK